MARRSAKKIKNKKKRLPTEMARRSAKKINKTSALSFLSVIAVAIIAVTTADEDNDDVAEKTDYLYVLNQISWVMLFIPGFMLLEIGSTTKHAYQEICYKARKKVISQQKADLSLNSN